LCTQKDYYITSGNINTFLTGIEYTGKSTEPIHML